MDDILAQVKERYEKARAKAEKAEKALDSARSELSDIETTLRVLQEMAGATNPNPAKGGPSEAVAERQANILSILGESQKTAVEPKELHGKYSIQFGEDVSLDTFRTTIWRMRERGPFQHQGMYWRVVNFDGRYWKEPTSEAEGAADPPGDALQNENEPTGISTVGSDAGEVGAPTPPNPWRTSQPAPAG